MRKASGDFPVELLNMLCNARPALLAESKAVKAGIAYLVWTLPVDKRRAHSEYDGYSWLHCNELRQRFGRVPFELINSRIQIFDIRPEYSGLAHHTRGYKLKPEATA